jgi:hypothetical protein
MTTELTTEPTPAPTSLINEVKPTATDPGAEPSPPVQELKTEPPAELKPDDFKLPEGFSVDEASMTSYLEFAKTQGLNKDQAQGALDLYAQQITQLGSAMEAEWNATQTQWQEQCRALPDIGGDKLDASLAEVARVIDRYGSQDLRTALDVTGAGNHPAVVQFLHKIAKAVNEAPPVSGQPTATATLSRADRMYNQGA